MRQHFFIDNWVSLNAGSSHNDFFSIDVPVRFDKSQLPKIEWVPSMQRRRLSIFAKMALYCAHHACEKIDVSLPSIFSSRHGDLHKTSMLLEDIAQDEALSPTAFSLSVHNAVSGLFTILTKNQQATNTVVAGKNTMLMAIIDGFARINTDHSDKLLIVHCDQALPDIYLPYSDELQIDHAVAFVISREKLTGSSVRVDLNELKLTLEGMNTLYPQALQIEQWLASQKAISLSC
ncbi:beta-ketoacyl synthase chain length factor [Thalassotalea piscium]